MSDKRLNRVFANPIWILQVMCVFWLNSTLSLPLRAQTSLGMAPQQPQSSPPRSTPPSSAASSLHAGSATVAPEDVSTMKLMPGSMVDLHVFEEPDLDGSYRLDDEGNISLPFAGAVRLGSLTLREAEASIRGRLITDQILKVANVDVNVAEYSALKITVLGEVNAPGSFPVLGVHKLQDVIALAGGETPLAGGEIVLQRFGSSADATETIHYNRNGLDASPLGVLINPGDTVQVKKAGIVYILGAVNRPGGYLMQEAGELNLDQVIAMAFGTSIEAKLGDLRVFRKMGDGSVVEIHADYKKINNGEATPLRLQPQDVVYVPPSSFKTLLVRGGTQIFNAAASATVYSAY